MPCDHGGGAVSVSPGRSTVTRTPEPASLVKSGLGTPPEVPCFLLLGLRKTRTGGSPLPPGTLLIARREVADALANLLLMKRTLVFRLHRTGCRGDTGTPPRGWSLFRQINVSGPETQIRPRGRMM